VAGRGGEQAPSRAVVYCVVPRVLAGKLHEPLRRYFREDQSVEVVVEQRGRDRRTSADRRAVRLAAHDDERRRIRALEGRRVADRRATVVAIESPVLPRAARAVADQIVFIERFEPSSEALEDRDTARLVTRIQAGERALFAELYMRYFDRVYGYVRVILKDPHEAEDVTQQAFMRVLEKIELYERRGQPFRAWLFVLVRNVARDWLKRQGKLTALEPEELDRVREQRDRENGDEADLAALSWVTDRELLFLIERLPLVQRQVLVLRFMLDLSAREIADVLEISGNHVSVLQYRALGYLRDRLTSLGRQPTNHQRAPMSRVPRKSGVLRLRRFALIP
jgi:RNA polymerase sigma-70 factor (ECF subfamily)